MGRKGNAERAGRAAASARAYQRDKATSRQMHTRWMYEDSARLSPAEEAAAAEKAKREAKKAKSDAFRREQELALEAAEAADSGQAAPVG